MANLADKYRGAGFLDDATAMIREALNATPIEDVHGNVGRAKEALHTQRESEAAKEQEILEQAERTREFRIRAAQAFLSPVGDSFDLTGSWDWKEWVPMHVVHSGTDVTGRYEKSTTTSWPSLSAFGGDVKTVQTKSIVLEGVLRGRTIRVSLKETLKSEYGSSETNTGTVETIFAASGDTGSVREELSDKTTRYYTVRRIDSSRARNGVTLPKSTVCYDNGREARTTH